MSVRAFRIVPVIVIRSFVGDAEEGAGEGAELLMGELLPGGLERMGAGPARLGPVPQHGHPRLEEGEGAVALDLHVLVPHQIADGQKRFVVGGAQHLLFLFAEQLLPELLLRAGPPAQAGAVDPHLTGGALPTAPLRPQLRGVAQSVGIEVVLQQVGPVGGGHGRALRGRRGVVGMRSDMCTDGYKLWGVACQIRRDGISEIPRKPEKGRGFRNSGDSCLHSAEDGANIRGGGSW